MQIAIIGSGRMGKGLAKLFAEYVDEAVWASRSFEHVSQLTAELGGKVRPVTVPEALQSDIVIPTLWFADILPWLEVHRAELKGKVLVDITNPFNASFDDFTTDWGTSASKAIQSCVPDTAVVGAFKNTFWQVLLRPFQDGTVSDVFVTSNNEYAKKTVMQTFQPLPFRFLDAGGLDNNRVIERMTLFSRELSMRYNHYPHVSWKLWGEKGPQQTQI